MKLAPIAVFAYKRLDTVRKTIQSLSQNVLASESELFIFSDGAKSGDDFEQVADVRKYLHDLKGFKRIVIHNSKKNKGLATSIIEGVSLILESYDSVIVLEDDLITSQNFLNFMNEALAFYQANRQIFSISGFSFPMPTGDFDIYFTKRSCSTGWATWKNRWRDIDWNLHDYDQFRTNRNERKKFNEMGSDLCKLLDDQMSNKINSWAIRWCYYQFKHQLFTVYPVVSKLENVGFGEAATNTKSRFNRFWTVKDNSCNSHFKFSELPVLENKYLRRYLFRYSILFRAYSKIRENIFSF